MIRNLLQRDPVHAVEAAAIVTMVDKKRAVRGAVTREYTIHLHKRLHDVTFKKRAPKAVKEIRKFAQKQMGTKDVRLDVKLNKAVWMRVCEAAGRLQIDLASFAFSASITLALACVSI